MIAVLIILVILGVPCIVSFFYGLICCEKMPNEDRTIETIKDILYCMHYDGFFYGYWDKHSEVFLMLRTPIVGFFYSLFLILIFILIKIYNIIKYIFKFFKINFYIKNKTNVLINKINNLINKILNIKIKN